MPFLINDDVGDHRIGAPAHVVVDPVGKSLVCDRRGHPVRAEVVDELLVVIIGVHAPPEQELLGVAHAHHGMGALFGAGQRGQQQGRQNRNNGNHHQQFDQCKRTTSFRATQFHLVPSVSCSRAVPTDTAVVPTPRLPAAQARGDWPLISLNLMPLLWQTGRRMSSPYTCLINGQVVGPRFAGAG